MFPHFTTQGVVPPYIGADPTSIDQMSPYRVTIQQFIEWFGYNEERLTILSGLLDYREKLVAAGITGFQWLGGSFVEDVENIRQRPPADVDVVSVIYRPIQVIEEAEWSSFLEGPLGYLIIDSQEVKKIYKYDAYVIDLNDHIEDVVSLTRYWIGLLSHQRVSSLWKGMMAVTLDAQQDEQARGIIQLKRASNLLGS